MLRKAHVDEENDDSVDAHETCHSIHFPAEVGELEDPMIQCQNTSLHEEQRHRIYELVEVEMLEVRDSHRRHV